MPVLSCRSPCTPPTCAHYATESSFIHVRKRSREICDEHNADDDLEREGMKVGDDGTVASADVVFVEMKVTEGKRKPY
jgi:hypothetical protein